MTNLRRLVSFAVYSVIGCTIVLTLGGYLLQLRAANEALARHTPISTSGGTLIIGGGGLPREVYERFLQSAGGRAAVIVVIPCYEADAADIADLQATWRSRGAPHITVLQAATRAEAERPEFAAPLIQATGVWLTGGDQSRAADLYVDTEVERQLHAVLRRGGVVGGSSAGASALSRVMVVEGRDTAVLKRGLGLLPDVLVDQHFLRRNRIQRLLGAIAERPDLIGLGIDEGTAVIAERDGRLWSVMGESYALVCLPTAEKLPRVEILQPGGFTGIEFLKRLARQSPAPLELIPAAEPEPMSSGDDSSSD